MSLTLYILPGLDHHKNRQGLELMKPFLNVVFIDYSQISTIDTTNSLLVVNDINYDHTSHKIPTIYGPHIVFQTVSLGHGNNGKIINTLSQWLTIGSGILNKNPRHDGNICYTDSGVTYVSLPFPVDVNKFIPAKKDAHCVFYFKRRSPTLKHNILNWIKDKQLKCDFFEYGSYSEDTFLHSISTASYVIWFGCHESQGFALQEILSCNTPIFVLDVDTLRDEKYPNDYSVWYEEPFVSAKATSASSWSDACGKICKSHDIEIINKEFTDFLTNLDKYTPRKFIIENLSPTPVANLWINTFHKLFPIQKN